MVVWLDYEATVRILDLDSIVIDSKIMLITAFISLACNIFNLIVLGHFPMPCRKKGAHDHSSFMDGVQSIYKPHGGHSCSGHGHGGHDHGHGHSHSHDHSHGHSHSGETEMKELPSTKKMVIQKLAHSERAERASVASTNTKL